ncbi:MAG: glutamate formimidoyltransferase [Bryobacterales bacterium]|nr:glutamate formimidoyltransferase [Bryobacterales bacterium]
MPTASSPLVECIPNFSEGRDAAVIGALAAAATATPGVALLDHTSDPDHNRSVFTLAGEPEAVMDAAVLLAGEAARLIDIRTHRGVHPRIGAMDVCPLVPVRGMALEQCAVLAQWTGNRIWLEQGVPVYFYEESAVREECRKLEDVRRGALAETLAPDVGGPAPHPTGGMTVVGARRFLIAFNVNLASTDLTAARHIAQAVRASSGGLPAVKALGLPLASEGIVQVSMNLVDFHTTSIARAFDAVASLADGLGIGVRESELIGLAPADALDTDIARHVKLKNWSPEKMILEYRLAKLNLD